MKLLAKLAVAWNEHRERRMFKQYLERNTWRGLIPGDVVHYKGRRLMYRGINALGSPGRPGEPEPVFGSTNPNDTVYYYLRVLGESFTDVVFGEDIPPVCGSAILIGYLNTTGRDFKKVDHITPEQWKQMVAA